MSRRGAILIATLLVAAVLAWLGWQLWPSPDHLPELDPLPASSPDGRSPWVREALGRELAALERLQRRAAVPRQELAEAWGRVGKLYLVCEREAAAEIGLRNAQRLAPDDPRWPAALGHLYRTAGKAEPAVAAYERVLALRPEDVPALVWLGRLHLERGRDEPAARLFRRALSLAPQSASARHGLGLLLQRRGDLSRAVEEFRRALEISPDATSIHHPLALTYRDLGDEAAARHHLSLAGSGVPYPDDPLVRELDALLPDPSRLTERGMEAYERGRWEDAERHFRAAVRLDGENPVFRLNLGATLARRGDAPGALAEFRETLRLSPGNPRALVNIGSLHAASGDHGQASAAFEAALRADPDLVEGHLGLADLLQQAGRYADALSHYDTLLRLDPVSRGGRLGASLALIRLGRDAEARRRLEETTRVLPRDGLFPLLLARLLATSSDDGVRDGERALELAQGFATEESVDALQTMAMALAEVGRFDEAARWQRRAIEAARQRGRADEAAVLSRQLRLYERGRPCRDFWLDP